MSRQLLEEELNVPEALYIKQSASVNYKSDEIFQDLHEALETDSRFAQIPSSWEGLDESTNCSLTKQIVWVVRYIKKKQ